MAGVWESRIERMLGDMSVEERYTVAQVAGMRVYAALATLETWREPRPGDVRKMIEVLTVIGEALLPELDEEAKHGQGTVREGVGRGAVCQ